MRQWIAAILTTSYLATAEAQLPTTLRVVEQEITVNGKSAKIYSIVQNDGTFGLVAKKGELFDVQLENTLSVPTAIHWHGLILPNNQDGVADITQFPIYPGLAYHYRFPLLQAGTFWMHAHFDLQQQKLLAAPLILQEVGDEKIADKEVVIQLTDFSFQPPEQILEKLRCNHPPTDLSINKMQPDIVEVDYDAFLANYHTLDHPEMIPVNPNQRVRLRFINAASSTNFFLSLGKLSGQAIAVDGNRIHPLSANRFELAVAQRIDIVVSIPEKGGAFPLLAQAEGTNRQTGVILATPNAPTLKLSSQAAFKAGALTNAQELLLRPLSPLPIKAPQQSVLLRLTGDMENYTWAINGQIWPEITPIVVEKADRIEITFINDSSMGHPMHLHGHVFEVTALNGKPLRGAMRDTLYIPAHTSASIQFDANNPGVWPLHCHLLYHQEAGMMTVIRYQDFVQPL